MKVHNIFTLALLMPIISLAERSYDFELQPLTVTAGKRAEDVQKLPSNLSVFGSQSLQVGAKDGIERFADLTPNLSFYSVGSRRTALLYMRGLGSSGPNMPAVGFFVDDVYYPKTGLSDISLHSIERVEVMRGPQSTLYGRNTQGGAINLVTARPGEKLAGRIKFTAGNYDLFRTDLSLSGPANADRTVFFMLDGAFLRRDGYTRNTFLNEDADELNRLSGRAKIYWLPSDDLELVFSVYADRDRDGGYALSDMDGLLANPYRVQHSQSGSHEREIQIFDLQARYQASDLELVSISAFRNWKNRDEYDQDFSPADIQSLYDTHRLRGFSQEFRVVSQDRTPLEWLGGVYFYYNTEDDDNRTSYGADAGMFGATPGLVDNRLLGFDTWGIAPFGRLGYSHTDRLRTMAGLRFEHQRKSADGKQFFSMSGSRVSPVSEFDADQSYDELMPEASISYDIAPDLMGYLRVARGFREGGFNSGETGADATYDPERAWSYEAGLKSSWIDKRLTLNLAAFHMDVEDMQLIQFKPGGFGFSFKNAGKAENRGVELELNALPFEWLELRGGFGYVDTRFKDFSDPALGLDYEGNSIPFVPDYNYHASATLSQQAWQEVSARGTLGVTGTGRTNWDEANTVQTGAYTLLNASVGLEYGRYALTIFGNNLADKTYPAAVYAFPGTSPRAQLGAPRTYGLMLSAEL